MVMVKALLALNINSPEHIGDWHSSMYWDHHENSIGDGQKLNTNHLLAY